MPGFSAAAARLKLAFRKWSADDCGLLAASMSYYATLAFLPLLLILTSGLGFFLRFSGWGKDAQERLLHTIAEQTSPTLADQVRDTLGVVESHAGVGGQIGIVTLLFACVAMFFHFERAFDRIWNIPRPQRSGIIAVIANTLFHRLKAFLMLLALGGLVILTFVADLTVSTLWFRIDQWIDLPRWLVKVIQVSVTVSINWLLIAMIYKVLPKVAVPWSAAAKGALFATITWEIGRQVLSVIIIGDKYSAYGVIGSFIAVMLWIYYAFAVLFLGAEYVQAICQEDSGQDAPPGPATTKPLEAAAR